MARSRGLLHRRSLRWRLAVAFAGLAALSALAIGLVLIPILANHYSRAEQTYLDAAAERAVRDLSTVSWKDTATLEAQAEELATLTQARVTLTDPSGGGLVAVGPPLTVQPPPAPQPLPNPLGAGLFGDNPSAASLPRSSESVSRPVNKPDKAGGGLLGYVAISEAPAYEQVALRNVAEAWALASLFGVAAAALVGLFIATWLTRPIRMLAAATDRMAAGDLSARADVSAGGELGALATSFNAMAARVDENVASLKRFVADAAHEIGTPLTALQADLELAETHAQTGDERRLVGRALKQTGRLATLSAGLLRLSRLESDDGGRGELERVDLDAVVRSVADAYSSRADQRAVELTVQRPNTPVAVMASAEKLAIAIGNLVDNALKFTPPDGTVTVGCSAEGGHARVWVSDTGVGIPQADLPRLFQRFHRGANVGDLEGSGLGLAIVRATVEAYGGTVCASSVSTGARFEISLPLA